jgi:YaiO family outer membrane protein
MKQTKQKNSMGMKVLPLLPLLILMSSISAEAYQGGSMYKNAVETQRNMFSSMINSPDGIDGIDFGFPNDRLEVDVSYDYLDPYDIYEDWTALNVSYYDKISNDMTILYQASGITRVEGEGFLGAVGVYKGWQERFYTFTQISAGTDTPYLPAFRIDQEFNYLFGEKKNIVGLLGFTYINQHDIHEDFIGSLGVTYYSEDYNIGYRIFFNQNDPGSVNSTSHIISLGVGHEKDQWIYVDVAFGNPAYLSTITPDYEAVNQDTVGVYLKYRKWIDENSGFYAETGFFDLDPEYKKYNFRIGYFKEF